MYEELTERQKAELTDIAMRMFVNQFGINDIIKEAFFDILLEAIYEEEGRDSIPVSSEARQSDHEGHQHLGQREMPTYEIE